MKLFWGVMGYLPLLVYGVAMYWLVIIVPRWFRRRFRAVSARVNRPSRQDSPLPPIRRRDPHAGEEERASRGDIGAMRDRLADVVTETVSVVLRRQVPPANAADARSWLGGLPCLPDGVAWPRSVSSEHPEQGERPLHFLAQVCCADLPAGLWGGLGPREGWLLFFLDPNQGSPEGSDSFRILHVLEPGEVRQPPFDLGPVHDKMYTGGSFNWLPKGQVPSTWRKWPVDLVSVPNMLLDVEGRVVPTPENFAATLHDGAPVLASRSLGTKRPYKSAQARRAVQNMATALRVELRAVTSEHSEALLREEDSLGKLREAVANARAKALGREDDDARARELARLDRTMALLESCETPDALRNRLEAERLERTQWRLATAGECDRLVGRLAAEDPDTPLSEADWNEMQAGFAGRQFRYHELRIEYPTGRPKHLELREVQDTVLLQSPSGTIQESLLDWLDPATRTRVPADWIDEIEASARSLTSNRPHRMGGYHDGVQSDAVEGPSNQVLLLQVASDDAMDWCWGDVGAYYFWIRTRHLAAGDFSGVEMTLECH